MRRRRGLGTGSGLSLTVVVLLGLARSVPAQPFMPTGRATLRGLPGIEVAVEPLPESLEGQGVSTERLHGLVVERLRAGGITVYASQRENPSPAQPYLYVHLNALGVPGQQAQAVAIQVQVRQTVRLATGEARIVDAMTWDSHDVVLARAEALAALEAEVLAHVDRFIDDWRAVH